MSVQIGINELKEITAALTARTGYAFDDFSQSFLRRRLFLFFEKFHIRHVDQFIKQLGSKLFIESLLYHFSVDTTEMFRDPGFWRALKQNVLSDSIVEKYPVWFPDIASGEELFSYLILAQISQLKHQQGVYFHHPSSSRIDEVKTGMLRTRNIELHESNFKRLELGGDFESFFKIHNNYLVLEDSVVQSLHFKKGWFLTEPETNAFSLIFFRNTMLYLNKNLQEKACQFIYDKLVPGGYFVIGIKESIPESLISRFQIIDGQERIYRKLTISNGIHK
jgi:chemotaxis protein methyltransferase CheR